MSDTSISMIMVNCLEIHCCFEFPLRFGSIFIIIKALAISATLHMVSKFANTLALISITNNVKMDLHEHTSVYLTSLTPTACIILEHYLMFYNELLKLPLIVKKLKVKRLTQNLNHFIIMP